MLIFSSYRYILYITDIFDIFLYTNEIRFAKNILINIHNIMILFALKNPYVVFQEINFFEQILRVKCKI